MDKQKAYDILSTAINEAYPIMVCSGYTIEYDEAIEALDYLMKGFNEYY